MCAMHTMCKTGTVCLRVAEPHFTFDRIGVRTIRTHMCRLLPADLALALKREFSFCPMPFLPPLVSGGDMYSSSTSISTIDTYKQGVVIIKGFVIRVNTITPPPLCNLHQEPIIGVIYNIFRDIIVETRLGICHPIYALVFPVDVPMHTQTPAS